MTISFPELPQKVRQFFIANLSKMEPLYRAREDKHALGGRFSSEELSLPTQVFTIEVPPAGSEADAPSPVEHGWLVFVGRSQRARTAEMAVTGGQDSEKFVFLGLSSGPRNNDLRAQLESLQQEASPSGESRTCRLLRIQELNLSAIWLKGNDLKADVFLPLIPVWAPFHRESYLAPEFFATVRNALKSKSGSAKLLLREET